VHRARISLLAILIFSFLVGYSRQPAHAQGSSAYDVIDAVNALRASQGLGPLKVNSILMGTAQGQSDYQASIGEVTHTGPGGTRPRDRAMAAGYGGGATVFISENIMGGINLSAQAAVQAWTGDSPHWNTMMGANYQDIGAGVATSGTFVYYTIDVGYVAGHAASNPTSATNFPAGTPLPTAAPIMPVITATPGADGAIIHVVEYGQTLISIALAYGVKVDDIRTLNGLPAGSTLIYPSEKLVIRKSIPATATATITRTPLPPTVTPTATLKPRTATPTATVTPTPTPTRKPLIPGMQDPAKQRRAMGIGLIVLCAFGLVAVGVFSLRSKD
jgi:hypothetical protein